MVLFTTVFPPFSKCLAYEWCVCVIIIEWIIDKWMDTTKTSWWLICGKGTDCQNQGDFCCPSLSNVPLFSMVWHHWTSQVLHKQHGALQDTISPKSSKWCRFLRCLLVYCSVLAPRTGEVCFLLGIHVDFWNSRISRSHMQWVLISSRYVMFWLWRQNPTSHMTK